MNNALLLTLSEAGARLSVSARTVRRLIDSGDLTPVRIGRAVRISTESLSAYVDRSISVSHNTGAGPGVREISTCRNVSKTKTASIVAMTPRTGGHPTSTRAANALAAQLGLKTDGKPRRS